MPTTWPIACPAGNSPNSRAESRSYPWHHNAKSCGSATGPKKNWYVWPFDTSDTVPGSLWSLPIIKPELKIIEELQELWWTLTSTSIRWSFELWGPNCPTPHPAEIPQGCAWLGHRLAAEGGHNNGIKFGTLKISFKGETMGKRRLNLFREFWGIPSSDKSKNILIWIW